MTQEPKLFPYITRLLQGASVEWKPLGEVVDFQNGFAFKSNLFRDDGEAIVRITNIDGKSVDLSDVKYFSISDYSTNMSPYKINKGDILIAMSGATTGKIGFYNYEYTSYLNQRVGKFIPKTNILNNRYLYHYLLSKVEDIYIIAGGGAQPNLSSNKLMEKIQIPLPPLSVQKEIVRILDKFTTLETELETELDCRKRQYEYYRNHLLTFGDEVEWKALGEVVKTTKNIKWQNNENTYDYIDLTSVCRETGNVLETLKIKADNAPSRAQKMVQLDDVIFATTRPSQMRIALIPKKFDGQIASTGYCVLRADKVNVLPKWIFFTLSTTEFKKFVAENQSGTAYPAISDSKLKEFKIPLPPLSEQQRIATILDKFDTLVNSISKGLPREIELRKKQYEYYREQLLSFPKT